MDLTIYKEAQKIWDQVKMEGAIKDMTFEVEVQKKLLHFFHVGSFYYYIFDVRNACFRYVSPGIQKVLGYSAEDITVEELLAQIHPDDQPLLLSYENEVVRFFAKLPVEKLTKYKFSYDYRIRKKSGEYIRILQQVITIQFDQSKGIHLTFGVHTDISHLKKENTSALSFIGFDGEPSYIDVNVENIYTLRNELFTRREKEILQLILKGYNTAAIAEKLFISTHTVNTHRRNIMSKTNAKTMLELALKVINEGLL